MLGGLVSSHLDETTSLFGKGREESEKKNYNRMHMLLFRKVTLCGQHEQMQGKDTGIPPSLSWGFVTVLLSPPGL